MDQSETDGHDGQASGTSTGTAVLDVDLTVTKRWALVDILGAGLVIAPDLDGRVGYNRAPLRPGKTDRDDRQAILGWLEYFRDRPDTYRAYTKEIDRFLRWAWFERGTALSNLSSEDVHAYFGFLAKPPARWVGPGGTLRGTPEWRPLRGPLSEGSLRHAKAILNTMFTHLVHDGHLMGNPCALIRARRMSPTKRIKRYLKRDEWNYLQQWLAELPAEKVDERRLKMRTELLCALLYLTAARRGDVALARMGDLERRDDGTWWWHVWGKGGKEAYLPVTDELVEHVRSYRAFHGLTGMPSPGEQTPLVLPLAGPRKDDKLLSDNMIYRAIKTMFTSASEAAAGQGLPDVASALAKASTHWLRHTSLTHQVDDGVPLSTVRDNARHASIATTSAYMWTDDRERHADTNEKLKMGTRR